MNDEKITVSKEELKNIVDKRIEERINNKSKEGKNKQSEGLDRREFLKKAGMGAAGLAALGISPAAATIDIRHPDNMILHNSDLDMNGNDIINVGNLGSGGTGGLEMESGTGYIDTAPYSGDTGDKVILLNKTYSVAPGSVDIVMKDSYDYSPTADHYAGFKDWHKDSNGNIIGIVVKFYNNTGGNPEYEVAYNVMDKTV